MVGHIDYAYWISSFRLIICSLNSCFSICFYEHAGARSLTLMHLNKRTSIVSKVTGGSRVRINSFHLLSSMLREQRSCALYTRSFFPRIQSSFSSYYRSRLLSPPSHPSTFFLIIEIFLWKKLDVSNRRSTLTRETYHIGIIYYINYVRFLLSVWSTG